MNNLQSDLLLFLNLAGSWAGISSRHIPLQILAVISNLGGQILFESDRVVVLNAEDVENRVREICGGSASQRPALTGQHGYYRSF